jgi:NADH dehydrogenase FAD-containing subunit
MGAASIQIGSEPSIARHVACVIPAVTEAPTPLQSVAAEAAFFGNMPRLKRSRSPVDSYLKIRSIAAEFAAGDVSWQPIDGVHPSVMSCRHGRPMGRFAGHNIICDLLAHPMPPLSMDWRVTCLDLSPLGATPKVGIAGFSPGARRQTHERDRALALGIASAFRQNEY